MAVSGMTLGAVFDMIGVIIREFRLNRWIVSLLDVVYWAAATVFVFRVLLYANLGQVRVFIFIGLLSGVLVYAFLFRAVWRSMITGIVRVTKQLVRLMIKLVRLLVIRPLLFGYRILGLIAGFFIVISVFIGKIMVQWIRSVWNLIKRLFSR